ncbi:MAG: response regulator transcription factor [Clostridia bacterium]|nr:response regulator transcription factor [Clostridia bacterium]
MIIAICDDDIPVLKKISDMVTEIMTGLSCEFLIKELSDGEDIIKYCQNNVVDIILADIDMPDKDGFEIVCELQKIQPEIKVVFVTAHEEYAFQAYDYQPFWFVSKRDLSKLNNVLTKLVTKITKEKLRNKIVYLKSDRHIAIDIDSVMYIKTDRHYLVVHEMLGDTFKFREGINEVYNQLAEFGFIYVHRCYLINCKFIKKFNSRTIILNNGEEISLSRNKDIINMARRQYGKYMREARW